MEAQINKGDGQVYHTYYRLSDGEIISKERIDAAIDLLNRLKGAVSVAQLTDIDLFTKGDKIEAIRRFHLKHDIPLVEAKAAIEFLRDENEV